MAASTASSSRASRVGLDWVNFFVADVQSGFASFVAFYLAGLGWSRSHIGIALTVGGLAGVLSQIPGGALADETERKRLLVALGAAMIAAGAVLLALAPGYLSVLAAEILDGGSAGLIGPAIAAISLGLVGRRGLSRRIGRNNSFQAAGIALTAAAMGLAGNYFSPRAIFWAAAALTLPVLAALRLIRSEEIDYARARNARSRERPREVERVHRLLWNRALIAFAVSAVLFRFADASILPLASEDVAALKQGPDVLYMAALVVAPSIVVAALAPVVGRLAERWGRKRLLLGGFAIEAARAFLLIAFVNLPGLVSIQLLSGLSSVTVTVLTTIIVADLTAGTGRFNFAFGVIGLLAGLAASLSTLATGYIVEYIGRVAGLGTIGGVAVLAVLTAALFLPETRPEDYGE